MLQRVRPDQVRLGMYVHALEGSWLEHPFWRRRFQLSDPDDVEALRASAVDAVVIDISKGAPPLAEDAPPPVPRQRPCSAGEEFGRAAVIIDRAKQAVADVFNEARLGRAVDARRLGQTADEISASIARNRAALISIARLKSADEYTYLHSIAVAALMINLARHMSLDESLVRDLGVAGLLHDIGKMAVPAALLASTERFSDSERKAMRAHAERGHKLLLDSGGVPPIALDVCLHHHERMDGSGYPNGLKGRQINLFARMAAVCDVYDATTSSRPYRPAQTPAESLAQMVAARSQFDSAVLAAFVESVGIYPVGALVRLSSDRLAVVVDERPSDPTRPRVRAFYTLRERKRVPPVDVPLSVSGQGERIVAQEDPGRWGFTDWQSLCPALMTGRAA